MGEMNKLSDLPLWMWIVIPIVLLAQGTWLFLDARKRGSHPWFWGIWGFIQTPTPLVLYLIIVRSGWFKRSKPQ